MAHVKDVDAALAFYSLVGFEPVNTLQDHSGRTFWAMARSGSAEIMFAQADGPVDPAQQAVLFYMYTADVRALRQDLLDKGVADGGVFRGQAGTGDGCRVVFAVSHPDYMRAGEVRVSDPDGYCILVGQLE
jgi:hypothetical protein